MVEKYSYKKNGSNNISEHFKVKEFASIGDSGKLYSDDVLIDTEINLILELLYKRLGCSAIIINSGYRTNEHELSLSKNAVKNGYHTKGMAVDINCYRNNQKLTSKEIVLALEDLNWNRGIGLISNYAVHIDSRTNKYYFDEMNKCRSIGDSFYSFYGVKKESDIETAIHKLVEKKIINNGDYWLEHYKDVKYLENLIIQFANNI